MDRPSTHGFFNRWHVLVEQYTPDRIYGRLLLGGITAILGTSLLALSLWGFVPAGTPTLVSGIGSLLAIGTGLPAVLLAVTVLWPVYLSLIGKLETTESYSLSDGASQPGGVDSVEAVKHRYAAGDITEEELEHWIEALLWTEEQQLVTETEDEAAANSNWTRERE